MENVVKNRYLNWKGCWVLPILLIAIIYFFVKIEDVPVLEYQYYFSDNCKKIDYTKQKDEEIAFLFTDSEGSSLSCKKLVIEQEVFCSESPCPDFLSILKLKTSAEGVVIVPQSKFNGKLSAYTDGWVEYVSEQKMYLFHIEGNYNKQIPFEVISTMYNAKASISVKMEQINEEYCNNTRWRKNVCDGY